jgi:hypothetical protein
MFIWWQWQTANPSTTELMLDCTIYKRFAPFWPRFGPVLPRLGLFGGRLRGSLAPGGVVVANQLGPIARLIVNRPVIGVMSENPPLF